MFYHPGETERTGRDGGGGRKIPLLVCIALLVVVIVFM